MESLDQSTHPLDEQDQGHIGLLASYAREIVRLFIYINGEELNKGEQSPLMRGVRISSKEIAEQFRKAHSDIFDREPLERGVARRRETLDRWMSSPPSGLYALAELAALFKLEPTDLEIFILVSAPAIDPSLMRMYSYMWDDASKRCPDVGFICHLLSMGDQAEFERLLPHFAINSPLRRHRLLLLEDRNSKDDSLDLNLVQRRVRTSDRVIDFLRRAPNDDEIPQVDEGLAAIAVRIHEEIPLNSLPLPKHSIQALLQLARSRKLPAVFEGPSSNSIEKTSVALAGAIGRGLLSVDFTALLALPADRLKTRLFELIREARFGGDLIYFWSEDPPAHISSPAAMVLQRLFKNEGVILGIQDMPAWMVSLTLGWPVIRIPMPDADHRLKLWIDAFAGDRRSPNEDALGAVARRYEMSPAQIQKAASEARRLSQIGRRKSIQINELDRACRAHFAHQLSDLADLVPPMPFRATDLILPDNEKRKFDEILLYSEESEAIYGEWGFGEKFPYGRGLSVLFYGPPGTGKTMGAMIIASALGLDLFRIDISRIMSRYVGETEKNLARIFDEAERGRVMLLFDEADSLFTKRTSVQSSVDRYANLEVAFLLQRMENFEGVTVLTTNVEQNLDDAFKRRIRYRIYFPMPDDGTRARLWQSLIPKVAPIAPNIPFDLLGEYFELTGGHIKQAVLRGAFYARRSGGEIKFHHLLEGATVECRELGMLISEKLPKKIALALKASVTPEELASTPELRASIEAATKPKTREIIPPSS